MNPRLYAALDHAGKIRSARWSTCPTCHAPIITGLDADTAALQARCDPTPINPLGETLAITQGRTTYDITIRDRKAYLDHRRDDHIRTRPAGTCDVLADHACGAAPLPAAPQATTAAAAKEGPDEPQF